MTARQKWYINGQELKYGSGTVQIKPDPSKMDTILFVGRAGNSVDTILCNIDRPGQYRFFYNACCGIFNVHDMATGAMIRGTMAFHITGLKKKRLYLATMGSTGMIIHNGDNEALADSCSGAMGSNVYKVEVKQIEECHDSLPCEELVCLQKPATGQMEYDFKYFPVSEIMNFRFMPLKNEATVIHYDVKKRTLMLE